MHEILYLGNSTDYTVTLDAGGTVKIRAENRKDGIAEAKIGAEVHVEIMPEAIRILKE